MLQRLKGGVCMTQNEMRQKPDPLFMTLRLGPGGKVQSDPEVEPEVIQAVEAWLEKKAKENK